MAVSIEGGIINIALVLTGRLADIASTRLASPKLRLEANPQLRQRGWSRELPRNIAISLSVSVLNSFAVMVFVVSVLAASENFLQYWRTKTEGEEAIARRSEENLRKANPRDLYASLALRGVLVSTVGLVPLILFPPRVGILDTFYLTWLLGSDIRSLTPGEGLLTLCASLVLYALATMTMSIRHARKVRKSAAMDSATTWGPA